MTQPALVEKEETMVAPSADPQLAMTQQARVLEPKGSNGVFTLPVGYLDREGKLHREVHLREITGVEEDILGSKQVPNHKRISMILANCLVSVGPISDRGSLNNIARELTLGDRGYLFFGLRRISLGDEYPFRARCPGKGSDGKDCGYEGLFELDLSTLEKIVPAHPARRVHETKLPSGKVVQFRRLTGNDEEELAKIRSVGAARSSAMFLRILTIDGEAPTLDQIKAMGMRDRDELWVAFDEEDGGMETSIQLQCPRCYLEFEEEVEPGQTGFFFPSRARRAWKKTSST